MDIDWKYVMETAHDNMASPCHVIEPDTVFRHSDGLFLLRPRLMLWNPVQQYHVTLKCPEHGTFLAACQSIVVNAIHKPRQLYHRDGLVHLVSTKYECKATVGEKHVIIATDEGLLNQVAEHIPIPFSLHHRSGLTAIFEKYISHRVMCGTKFHDLSMFMKEEVISYFATHLDTWCALHQCCSLEMVQAPSYTSVFEFIGEAYPSADFLRDTYVKYIRKHEPQITVKQNALMASILSMDHTFKVSVNIGYERQDKVWVTLYDSLFCVLNEEGHVLSHTLCKDRSFSSIEASLEKVQENVQTRGGTIDLVAVDNCCQWRKQLQKVFSQRTVVKLDVFHAVQRITKTIPKGLAYRTELMRELRQVFRTEGDTGLTRLASTPSKDVIITKFQAFVDQWDEAINEETRKACTNLKLHIDKGCLSDIPAGVGTNRNERLHRLLNKSALAVGRIGPELAQALLKGIFYTWNMRKLHGHSLPLSGGADNMHLQQKAEPNFNRGKELSKKPTHDVNVPQEDDEPRLRQAAAIEDFVSRKHDNIHHLHQLWQQLLQEILSLRSAYDVTKFTFAYLQHVYFIKHGSFDAEHKHVHQKEVELGLDGYVIDGEVDTFCQEFGHDNSTSVVLITCDTHFHTIPIYVSNARKITYMCIAHDHGEVILRTGHRKDSVQERPKQDEEATSSASHVSPNPPNAQTICRCGERTGKTTLSCSKQAAGYKSRCPCLRIKQPCTARCRCVGCGNGKPSSVHCFGASSTRRRKITTPRPSGKRIKSEQFLEETKEDCPQGPWTDLETIALQLGMCDFANIQTLSAAYSALTAKCVNQKCKDALRDKKTDQVAGKQVHIARTLQGLQTACCAGASIRDT